MGAFFANIQIRNNNLDIDTFENHITNTIIKNHCDNGYNIVEKEEDADNSVIVARTNNPLWITLLDEECEDMDLEKLNKLASQLSIDHDTVILAILVNDSDYLYIGLFYKGSIAGKISNLSEDLEFNFEESQPDVWASILNENVSFQDIKRLFDTDQVFVEKYLEEFAGFLNLNSSGLLTGYRYFSKENPEQGIKLHFAKQQEKPVLEKEAVNLHFIAYPGVIDLINGETSKTEWFISNRGLASEGIQFVIAGKAIEDGNIKPLTIKIRNAKDTEESAVLLSFIETVSTSGEKMFYVQLADFSIIEGSVPPKSFSTKKYQEYWKQAYQTCIISKIDLMGLKEADSDFNIFVSPLSNKSGYTSNRIDVKVTINK